MICPKVAQSRVDRVVLDIGWLGTIGGRIEFVAGIKEEDVLEKTEIGRQCLVGGGDVNALEAGDRLADVDRMADLAGQENSQLLGEVRIAAGPRSTEAADDGGVDHPIEVVS